MNANVVVVAEEFSASYQFLSASTSLAGLGVVAVFYTWQRNYTVPIVVAWASTGIYVELMQPQESMLLTFDKSVLESLQYAALGLAITIATLQVVVAVLRWRSSASTGRASPTISSVELSGRSPGSMKSKDDVSRRGGDATNYVQM